MIGPAVPGHEAAIEAFLAKYPATSMFLRGNLAAHGLGASDSPNATTYHLHPAEGPISAVLGLTQAVMALCQLGETPEALASLAPALEGQRIIGLSGDAAQIDLLIDALRLGQADFRMNHVEPLFHLDLARLHQSENNVRQPVAEDQPLIANWLRTYLIETGLGLDGPTVEVRAGRAVSAGLIRFLLEDGQPVAMAAINARAGNAVQVGGVFVPPEARNRGLGRRVTQALLAEARSQGATDAFLFSNNDAATKAYISLGFTQIGTYRIAFLRTPQDLELAE
ncbi:MAG: GNAT family N-acetyltransferase [Tabrizicola sp.]|nr:GNAT family N-acetyltransferase [Tabrizicola sp.]